MESEVDLGDRKIVIHEMDYYKWLAEEQKTDRVEKQKQMFRLSGVPEDIINMNPLPFKYGSAITTVINNLNGFGQDFQKPSKTEDDK